MKKTLYCALAAAGVLGLAACSNDDVMAPAGDGVNITVKLPRDIATRGSFGDGTDSGDRATLNNLAWTVFEVAEDGTQEVILNSSRTAFGTSQTQETVNIPLAKGKTYQVAFYADDSENGFAKYENGVVTVDYSKAASNVAAEDAFIGKSSVFTVSGAYNETVTLTRPFAQLNWGTDDADAEVLGHLDITAQVKIASGLYTSMNVIDGKVDGAVSNITFAAVDMNNLPTQTFPVVKEDATADPYELIAMNYLLTGNGTIDCELVLNEGLSPVKVNAAPVQVNHRTNIYGSLLTAPGEFNIIVDNNFVDPDNNVNVHETTVATPAEFIAALSNPDIKTVKVPSNLDLSDATAESLTFETPKTIEIAPEATIQLGNKNCITAKNGITLKGGGKITNTSDDNSDLGAGYQKSLIHCMSGELVVDNVTLENDLNYHYHGSAGLGNPYNSSAISYWGDTNVTITDATINSGEFTLCGMGRPGTANPATGKITLTNSTFNSTSSSQNGTNNWSYALRIFGTTAELNNCNVTGIQGGVSTETVSAVINGGTYQTVNSEGKIDAFYAVYATNGSQITINGGKFSSPNDRSGLNIEGTSCVVAGDNDTGLPGGAIIIKGGEYSGKPYNHDTKEIYAPEEGYEWKSITSTELPLLKWEAVKK